MFSLSPIILFNILLVLGSAVAKGTYKDAKHPKGTPGRSPSVIVIIPDGFGPSLATVARHYKGVCNATGDESGLWPVLEIDKDVVGTIKSRSADNLVTDSAAAGTALSTGVSTNNGYIGYDPDFVPIPNVLEGAKALGYNTGLVATSRITHATPAAYSAHVLDRGNEALIAEQQLGNYVLGRQVDLLWGGGQRFFLPQNATGSRRTDDQDLIAQAREQGYKVLLDREQFDEYIGASHKLKRNRFARDNARLPSIGLFTNNHLSFEIDRDPAVEPSLAELSVGAIDALSSDGTPFFLMIEASRIDHAAHGNDAPTTAWDTLAYDQAWTDVKAWVSKQENPYDYIVLSMADHDTGALGLPDDWSPTRMLNATASAEYLAAWAAPQVANQTLDFVRDFINNEIIGQLGIPALNGSSLDYLAEVLLENDGYVPGNTLSEAANNYTGLAWGTGGHSSVDVNLYLYPNDDDSVIQAAKGTHKNVWVGQWIAEYLGMDLAAIKEQLVEQEDLGGPPLEEEPTGPVIA